jgi:hypothetical protein
LILFIQIYVHDKLLDALAKEGLLEDSLKLPFTVFITKQKQKMRTTTTSYADGSSIVLSVIDVTKSTLSLMQDETGDMYEVRSVLASWRTGNADSTSV